MKKNLMKALCQLADMFIIGLLVCAVCVVISEITYGMLRLLVELGEEKYVLAQAAGLMIVVCAFGRLANIRLKWHAVEDFFCGSSEPAHEIWVDPPETEDEEPEENGEEHSREFLRGLAAAVQKHPVLKGRIQAAIERLDAEDEDSGNTKSE